MQKKIWAITLLSTGVCLNLFAQNYKIIDSLFHILKTARHDTTRFNAYIGLGDYFQNSNPDTAIYFHSQAERVAEKISGVEGELKRGNAIQKKGWDYYIKSDYENALKHCGQSLKIAEKYQNHKNTTIQKKAKDLLAANFGNFGIVYYAQGNYSKSLEYYFQALKIYEEIGNKQGQAANLGNIGNVYYDQGNYSKALEYYFQSLKICEEIGNKQGQAANLGNIGIVYKIQGNYSKALEYYFQALKINEEIGYKQGQAANLGDIGLIYSDQGNYSKALEYYFQALKINEEIGYKIGRANNLGNIGFIYSAQGNYSKALEYYFQALKIYEEIGDKLGQAINLGNIGSVYNEQGDYVKALEYYFKALKIYEDIGDKNGLATNLGNIGIVFKLQGDYVKALEYYFKALKIHEDIGDKRGLAINLENIGIAYLNQKKYKEAEEYLRKAEQLNRELGTINVLSNNCQSLSELYELKKNYPKALYYYKEHIKYRDSVFSEENRKASIQKEMQYKFEKEQLQKEAEHQKQLAVQKAEKKKQQIISYAVGGGLVLVLVFSVVIFNRLQITRKQKNIIEKQKQIVEEQKQLVEEQKKIVEEKNKDILDSIHYAKRIQDAILPSSVKWKSLLPDSFVLYQPKDIIAGDFYFLEETEKYLFVAAADCTGHGVPGAMVSVVCSGALTRAIREEGLYETNQILDKAREIVIERLSGEEHLRDGMDICFVRIEKGTNKIQYSGANRPLWIINTNGEFTEIKPDKQPVGKMEAVSPFTAKEIQPEQNTLIYLTTDGFSDQFGGDKGKKLSTKVFKQKLTEICAYPMDEQYNILNQWFNEWKGNETQTDDVTVIGIKV